MTKKAKKKLRIDLELNDWLKTDWVDWKLTNEDWLKIEFQPNENKLKTDREQTRNWLRNDLKLTEKTAYNYILSTINKNQQKRNCLPQARKYVVSDASVSKIDFFLQTDVEKSRKWKLHTRLLSLLSSTLVQSESFHIRIDSAETLTFVSPEKNLAALGSKNEVMQSTIYFCTPCSNVKKIEVFIKLSAGIEIRGSNLLYIGLISSK